MKFLITSDNHLGFKERDRICNYDSFITFEEILRIAEKENVDFIIQAGDLFHYNKPSRFTMNLTLKLLKKYCMGDKEINFKSNTKLNIYDLNLNIKIPIIAINGNHDDPCGHGSLSALNILNTAGLINYVGNITNYDKIEIHPILIEGDQKIAIYPLSHLKDLRLYRAFLQNKISFLKPADSESWYNILVVHQNRIKRREKEYLPEEFIDSFFDLVIYGHEHDTFYYKNIQKGFDLIQVGSSVRTSLCEAELKEKFVYLVDDLKIKPVKLKTVRKFVMDQIKIDDENYEEIIENKVEQMIGNDFCFDYDYSILQDGIDFDSNQNSDNLDIENKNIDNRNINSDNINPDNTLGYIKDFILDSDIFKIDSNCDESKIVPANESDNKIDSTLNDSKIIPINELKNILKLPLIRLKIETNQNIKINRLALSFKNKVANYDELFLIKRKQKSNQKIKNQIKPKTEFIEIFSESLKNSNLKMMSENLILKKFIEFIEKDEKKSLEESFNEMIGIQLSEFKEIVYDNDEIEKRFLRVKNEINLKVGDFVEVDGKEDEDLLISDDYVDYL